MSQESREAVLGRKEERQTSVRFDLGEEGQELVIMSRWEGIGVCGEKMSI